MGDITTGFVKQYGSNIMLRTQQKGSRLRMAVSDVAELNGEPVVGEEVFVDQLAPDTATKRTTRNADTPITAADHRRRKVILYDYEVAKLLDKQDKLKMLADPNSKYVINGGNALGRAMDDEIITALGGTAYTGKTGSSSQALPSAQKIAVASAGLTFAKVLEAAEILNDNDVDEDDRFFVYTSKQLTNLLNTTQATSSDYVAIKALMKGEIDVWMGFKWIRSQRLGVDGSGNRLCYAFHKTGVALAVAQDIMTRVGERADKSYAMQTYLSLGVGATRLEEEKVVEIACQES